MHTTHSNTQYKNESRHTEMGPVRQNPIQRIVRSVHVCTLHCAQLLHTILHRTDLIIFPLTLQTITIAPMMSIWGTGVIKGQDHSRTYGPIFLNRPNPSIGAELKLWSSHLLCVASCWLTSLGGKLPRTPNTDTLRQCQQFLNFDLPSVTVVNRAAKIDSQLTANNLQ